MTKCPSCATELSFLFNFDYKGYKFSLKPSSNKPVYQNELCIELNYSCPSCGNTIASSEEDAVAFLKGKKVVE